MNMKSKSSLQDGRRRATNPRLVEKSALQKKKTDLYLADVLLEPGQLDLK